MSAQLLLMMETFIFINDYLMSYCLELTFNLLFPDLTLAVLYMLRLHLLI